MAIPFAFKLRFRLLHRLAREGGVDGKQVRYAGLVYGIELHEAVAVRNGALEFLQDHRRVIHDGDVAVGVRVGLAHFLCGILEAHQTRADLRDVAFRDAEGLAMHLVEADGNVPRELDMLLLVIAHGHKVALVKQDVRSHQHGIGVKTGVDIVRMFLGFVLELGHAVELTHVGAACKRPVQLRVLLHMGLHEHHGPFRVNAAGKQQRDRIECALPELVRILPDGRGMQIGYTIITEMVFRLQKRPVAQRTHIVAERRRTGGLNAA